MPNPNPLQARLAKKQKVKKAGDLPALCRKLWQGILEADIQCGRMGFAKANAKGIEATLLKLRDRSPVG